MQLHEKLSRIYEEILTENQKANNSPVLIGDCLDWIENDYIPKKWEEASKGAKYPQENPLYPARIIEVLYKIWKDKRLSIDNQPEELIDYVYSLLPKK